MNTPLTDRELQLLVRAGLSDAQIAEMQQPQELFSVRVEPEPVRRASDDCIW